METYYRYTHFCRIRDRGSVGRPPPTNNFGRTKLTPTNHISLEMEFHDE